MTMAKTAIDRDLSSLSIDRFEVDAFSMEKRKFGAGCFTCTKDSSKELKGHRVWDGKPRTMGTLEFVLRYVQIFSRMSPDDKALLIQQLQSLPNAPVVVRSRLREESDLPVCCECDDVAMLYFNRECAEMEPMTVRR